MSAATLARSPKLVAEEEIKGETPAMCLPIGVYERQDKIQIKPLVTHGEWLMVMPFAPETNLILPQQMQYKNFGVVIGSSETMMAPNGNFVKSLIKAGDVVMFMERTSPQEVKLDFEPYKNRKIILISERNIMFRMAKVPYELVD